MRETSLSHEKLEKILSALRSELSGLLGSRMDSVYLYGSRARGDARPDSDIDILIVIQGDFDYSQILDITSEAAWKLSLENDVVISRVFVSREAFDASGTPFLANFHREALRI